MNLPFFHGYIEPLDGIAAMKHGTQSLMNGTLFDDLKEACATLHCCESAVLSLAVGEPAFSAAGSDSAKLGEACDEFCTAVEAKRGDLQQAAQSQRQEMRAGEKMNPAAIFAFLMSLYEFIKSLRT